MPDPYLAAVREEADLARLLWGDSSGFFWRLRQTPDRFFRSGIRRSSILPIVRSSWWAQAVEAAQAGTATLLQRAARIAGNAAVRGIPGSWRAIIERLADEPPELEAVKLIQGVDAKNRRGLSGLIRSAAARYGKDPRPATLTALADEIRPMIGLTPWQAGQVRSFGQELTRQGAPEALVLRQMRKKAGGMILQRSRFIAESGVVEQVAETRHATWLEGLRTGIIDPAVLKRARHQGDRRVRQLHRMQGDLAPIPLEMPYAIFGAARPPWPGQPG